MQPMVDSCVIGLSIIQPPQSTIRSLGSKAGQDGLILPPFLFSYPKCANGKLRSDEQREFPRKDTCRRYGSKAGCCLATRKKPGAAKLQRCWQKAAIAQGSSCSLCSLHNHRLKCTDFHGTTRREDVKVITANFMSPVSLALMVTGHVFTRYVTVQNRASFLMLQTNKNTKQPPSFINGFISDI